MPREFTISVGDESVLSLDEIWPDGDAPENPTVQDVIAHIKATSNRQSFARDWGFDEWVEVNGRPVWT